MLLIARRRDPRSVARRAAAGYAGPRTPRRRTATKGGLLAWSRW